jgi:hypothetical protein
LQFQVSRLLPIRAKKPTKSLILEKLFFKPGEPKGQSRGLKAFLRTVRQKQGKTKFSSRLDAAGGPAELNRTRESLDGTEQAGSPTRDWLLKSQREFERRMATTLRDNSIMQTAETGISEALTAFVQEQQRRLGAVGGRTVKGTIRPGAGVFL